jgi:hypothetical protein
VKYLLIIYVAESDQASPEEAERRSVATDEWVKEMDGRGVRLEGSALRSAREGRSVRVSNGELLVADGPFAETKEQVAGFDVLECRDLDEAIEVASKHPVAGFGALEVRPFWEP